MESSKLINVVIVDGNAFLRAGLKLYIEIEADIKVTGDFESGAAAVAEIERLKPHVVMMSVHLPDMSGYDACRRVLDASAESRVIMLTSQLDDAEILSSIMAGAAGILPKDAHQNDLIRTVRANAMGELLHIPAVANRVLNLMRGAETVADVDRLTDRETQILIMVADGLSNEEIGAKLTLSRYTIRNHVGRIFSKLKLSTRAELGAYAARIGLLDSAGAG